jgi:hypothetical protein
LDHTSLRAHVCISCRTRGTSPVCARQTTAELSLFLIKRGLWLILLELTVVSFGWIFAPSIPVSQVFWVIGVSMIMLAVFIWLPLPAIAGAGFAFVCGHRTTARWSRSGSVGENILVVGISRPAGPISLFLVSENTQPRKHVDPRNGVEWYFSIRRMSLRSSLLCQSCGGGEAVRFGDLWVKTFWLLIGA